MDRVCLGFVNVEETVSWKLHSKFFPSKVGGKPSWLALKNLPEPSELICKVCSNPLVFLLQVYAYIDKRDENDTYHRTIYVFMCSRGKCTKRFSNDNFVVFRTQLPRTNEFYSFDEPEMNKELSNIPSAEQFLDICNVCGCKAVINCEKDSKRNYCSDIHKNADWNRIQKCTTDRERKKKIYLLPEYEIECEAEDLPSEDPEKTDKEKMMEYHQFMKSSKAPKELQGVPLDDLDLVMKKSDKAFNKFRKRVSHNPEQIIRYQRHGNPLFVSSDYVPAETDIPPCTCGAKRIFEFQIMPQLLIYLPLDSIEESPDWGTLLIYTCSKSCDAGTNAYVKEFLWKQDFSDN